MSLIPSGISIQEAYRRYRNNQLIVNRKYQRKLVWTEKEKQMLIDSIVHEYPIPLILFAETQIGEMAYYEILDGMQRLNAIFGYIENEFSYNGKYFDVKQLARAKQLNEQGVFPVLNGVDILDARLCANFLDYQLAVTSYQTINENTIIEVFGRINSGGKRLSNQESRQAGVISKFADVVRQVAADIRGDSSGESIQLFEMPEISIGSSRINDHYGLKAENIFWVKQGVLAIQNLRDSDDEEMIADIAISILQGSPFARSKEFLDDAYNKDSDFFKELDTTLAQYGAERLIEEIKNTFSVLKNSIETVSSESNFLRKTLYPSSRSPIKNAFYTTYMAFFDLLVKQDLSPADIPMIFDRLRDLQSKLTVSTHYTNIEDRRKNIALTVGLIQCCFVKKEPSTLKHGAGLAIDFENSIRRSKIETSKYEFKQGFLRLSDDRKYDNDLEEQILHTICAMANIGPESEGYIYIGVADKEADAVRIKTLDGTVPIKISFHSVVGVDREARKLGISLENYCRKIASFINKSKLSNTLITSVLANIDVINYQNLSIIRIKVPSQFDMSYCDDKVYIRQHNNTVEVKSAKEIVAISQRFTK